MFFDRYDVGKQLASRLGKYRDSDAVVLARPRGGVLVGYEIATTLNLPLEVVITRKIGHPLNPEAAVCVVTEDGQRVCSDYGLCGIETEWIQHASDEALAEARHKREIFGTRSRNTLSNKTVIITDDGIATGLTMKAALLMLRAQKPKRAVLAIPVCPRAVLDELRTMVDEVVILEHERSFRGAVSKYYTHFPAVFDKEVLVCLRQASTST